MNAYNPIRVIIEALPPADTSWVDVLSALLTPVIALLAIYIAYQQYKVNSLRLQHELYGRRLRVYKAVQIFLSEIGRDAKVGFPRCLQFYAEASEAVFLFDKSFQEYIDMLYKRATQMAILYEKLYLPDGSPVLPVGEERSGVAREHAEMSKWFSDQLVTSKELFRKHMGIN